MDSVRSLPLLRSLGDERLEHVLSFSSVERYPSGTVLFREGSLPDHLHVLLSGTVELYTSHASRDCGILLMSAGDLFMPAAALFNEPYLNSARALTTSRILLLNAKVAREEFSRSAELAMQISRVLAGQFRMAVRHVIDLKCRNAPQRLAAFLLRLVDESNVPGSAELPIPKRSLASRVGMTAETLSRTLQTLADNGLVVRGNRVLLRDRSRIEAFCGPPPYADVAEEELGVHAL